MARANWERWGGGYSCRFGKVQLIVEHLPSRPSEWHWFVNDEDGHIYSPDKEGSYGSPYEAQKIAVKWHNGGKAAVISGEQSKTLWYFMAVLVALAACAVAIYYNADIAQTSINALYDAFTTTLAHVRDGVSAALAVVWLWTWRIGLVLGVMWALSNWDKVKPFVAFGVVVAIVISCSA